MSIEWKETWVSVVDVLGFSERLRTEPDKLAEAYRQAIPNLPYGKARFYESPGDVPYWVDKAVFSDSLIFWAKCDGDDPKSRWLYFVLALSTVNIVRRLLQAGLPTRAAISFGKVHEDSSLNILMGDAIVKAHLWEQQQEWAWVSLSPDSLDAYEAFEEPPVIHEHVYEVPTKAGYLRTVTYPPFTDSEGNDTDKRRIAKVVGDNLKKSYRGGRAAEAIKWSNTASFLSAFVNNIKPSDRYVPRRLNDDGWIVPR